MKKFTLLEALGYIALVTMSVMWIGFAWYVFVTGGFYKGYRYSQPTYIDGASAIVMGYIILTLAPITLAIVLKRLEAPKYVSIAIAVLLLTSPMFYFLLR